MLARVIGLCGGGGVKVEEAVAKVGDVDEVACWLSSPSLL